MATSTTPDEETEVQQKADLARQAETAAKASEGQTADELRAENERIRKALAETNRKATADRKFREDFEREQEDRKKAQMGEVDRLKQELADRDQRERDKEAANESLKAENLRLRVDGLIERAAIAAGFENPELAPRLIDRERITSDPDSGKIEGVKEAVDRLAKEYPGLVRSVKSGLGHPSTIRARQGGGNGSDPQAVDPRAEVRAKIRYMG